MTTFETTASLTLQGCFFVAAVRYMQDTLLFDGEAEDPPPPAILWRRAALTGLLLAALALGATLLTIALGVGFAALALASPGAYVVLLFLLGKLLFLAAATAPFRLIFKVSFGRALKAAGYATLAALGGDLLVRLALKVLGATIYARPWTMGLFIAALGGVGAAIYALQRRRERRFAVLAATASEHDGKSLAEQVAASTGEHVPVPAKLDLELSCPHCDTHIDDLTAEFCPSCGKSLAPEAAPLDWRWIGGGAAATVVLGLLLGALLGPPLGARWRCDFSTPPAAQDKRCASTSRWGVRGASMLPPRISQAPDRRVLFVSGWRYVALLSLAFLLGGLVVAWRVGPQPMKSALLVFVIAWLATTAAGILLLGFAATRAGLVYGAGLHTLAGLAWLAVTAMGGKLGYRLGRRSEFEGV